MDTKGLKQAIKDKLLVVGAENVYLDPPRMHDLSDIYEKALTLDQTYFQFWLIRRMASRPETIDSMPGSIAQCVTRWYHRFAIECNVAYREGDGDITDSCEFFDALLDGVLEGLAMERTFGNIGWSNVRPIELIDSGQGSIGNEILTHQGLFVLEMIQNQAVSFQ